MLWKRDVMAVESSVDLETTYLSESLWVLQGSGRVRSCGPGLGLAKVGKLANYWRARSRLYQNEILQENMRLTAFFKLYKICILLHRCNLKILAKNRLKNQQIL